MTGSEKLKLYCERGRALFDELLRQVDEGRLDTSLVSRDCLALIARRCEHDAELTAAAFVSRATAFYLTQVCNVDPVSPRVRDAVLYGIGIGERGL